MHLISQKATFVEKNHKIWRACLSVASLHNQLKVSEPTVWMSAIAILQPPGGDTDETS